MKCFVLDINIFSSPHDVMQIAHINKLFVQERKCLFLSEISEIFDTPSRSTPCEAHTPGSTLPSRSTHTSGSTPTSQKHTLPHEAHPSGSTPPTPTPDGHCSRRYTSYWNAFLHISFSVGTFQSTGQHARKDTLNVYIH